MGKTKLGVALGTEIGPTRLAAPPSLGLVSLVLDAAREVATPSIICWINARLMDHVVALAALDLGLHCCSAKMTDVEPALGTVKMGVALGTFATTLCSCVVVAAPSI
jgi:hypothetical protein